MSAEELQERIMKDPANKLDKVWIGDWSQTVDNQCLLLQLSWDPPVNAGFAVVPRQEFQQFARFMRMVNNGGQR